MVDIELTELLARRGEKADMRQHPAEEPLPKTEESINDGIVSTARKIYFDGGNSPVLSQILFSTRAADVIYSNRTTCDKGKCHQIARLMAAKIQGMRVQNSQVIEWRSGEDQTEESPLSESVSFIRVHVVPKPGFARWTVARCGWVHSLTHKHLQDRINDKAKKLNSYQGKTEEIWLLIVADRTRPSQNLRPPHDFHWDLLSSPFARTFYYGYPDEAREL